MFDTIQFSTIGYNRDDMFMVQKYGEYVESFFVMLLKNFAVKGFGKLVIDFSRENTNHVSIGLLRFNSVIVYQKHFYNERAFFTCSSIEKLHILITELDETFQMIQSEYPWDLTEIHKAVELCKKLDFKYRFLFGPLKSSPDRKYKACVGVDMNYGDVYAVVVFFDGAGKQLKTVQLEKIEGTYYTSYCYIFGKRKWLNSNEYEVVNAGCTKKYITSINEDSCYIEKLHKDVKQILKAGYHPSRPKLLNYPEI